MKQDLSDITIFLPVWNAGQTIERCLMGILAQELGGARLVVVDNCSDDDTRQQAAALLEGVPNCRIERNGSNVGRIGNWNRCLDLCETKYLKFALANDVLMKGSLGCLATAAKANPSAAMICSRFCMVDSVPTLIPEVETSPATQVMTPSETSRFFAENGFRTGGFNGMMLNMEYVRTPRLRFREDIPYCADYFFAIELAQKGTTAFVAADTYLFDAGASGRFHFVGLKQPGKYFLEQRECAQLLAQQTGDRSLAYRYLAGQFHWFLGQGVTLDLASAWNTFADAPPAVRIRATWNTLKFNLNKLFGRGIRRDPAAVPDLR